MLVIICAFSKYIIAGPLKRKTSRCVAKAFFQHYILIFGLPSLAYLTVTQDNGGEFISSFNKTLQHMLGISPLLKSDEHCNYIKHTREFIVSCTYAK